MQELYLYLWSEPVCIENVGLQITADCRLQIEYMYVGTLNDFMLELSEEHFSWNLHGKYHWVWHVSVIPLNTHEDALDSQ